MERFQFVCDLGEGAYGHVWKCYDRENQEMVAVKRFKETKNYDAVKLAAREISLLKNAKHPNIVRMLDAFRSKSDRLYIVMEYAEHTLTQILRASPRGLDPNLTKLIMHQLVDATAYLHRSGVIHRDLKPANILLNKKREVKICDFGFARKIVGGGTAPYTGYVVTRWYRAPEVLVGDDYGPEVDIWSLGCLFAEMVLGRPLFPGDSTASQLAHIMQVVGKLSPRQLAFKSMNAKLLGINPPESNLLPSFSHLSPAIKQVLSACLQPDPATRLTAEEILRLPYFWDVQKIHALIDTHKQAPRQLSPQLHSATDAHAESHHVVDAEKAVNFSMGLTSLSAELVDRQAKDGQADGTSGEIGLKKLTHPTTSEQVISETKDLPSSHSKDLVRGGSGADRAAFVVKVGESETGQAGGYTAADDQAKLLASATSVACGQGNASAEQTGLFATVKTASETVGVQGSHIHVEMLTQAQPYTVMCEGSIPRKSHTTKLKQLMIKMMSWTAHK